MKEYIKKNINNIIGIFLLLSPILDLLTGLNLHYLSFPLTIGMMIRFIFLLGMLMIVVLCFKKKQAIIPYIIVGIYSIFFLIGIEDKEVLLPELQNLIKVFYFPLLFSSLYLIRKEIKISNLTLFTVLFLYLIFLFVPITLGIGYKSYKITKEGTLGFFNSANEISGIISILTPILFIIISTSKKIIPKTILIIMYLIVILTVGTKTPLLTLCFVTGATLLYYWIKWIKQKEEKKVLLSTVIVTISFILLAAIIPKTNFYKNIETHLDFLGVKKISEIFQKEELIDHFIFSQRLTFLHEKASIYRNANTYQKLFGVGLYQENKEIKTVEMDYFDIYYNFGLIGFLIFFGITLTLLYQILIVEEENSFERFMLRTSLILIIILSFFTGHIIVSPSVSILVIMIVLSLNDDRYQRILVTGEKLSKNQKDWLKTFDKETIHLTTVITKEKYSFIKLLLFKILNYENYDGTIYIENTKEIGKELLDFSSKNKMIYLKKYKNNYPEYNWIITEKKIKNKEKNILYYQDKKILEKILNNEK